MPEAISGLTLDGESPRGLHFFFDLPVDGGFPVNACSIRC
jgi:hypothetical protein